MPIIWRVLLSIYNLLLLVVAGIFVAASVSAFDPLPYLQTALNEQNRLLTGLVALLLLLLALVLLIQTWKTVEKQDDGIIVQEGLLGQICMTVPAIELLIMKSVRQIEGIKDIRPEIKKDKTGLTVKLHMMINPALNVPEVTAATQKIVKEQLEQVGGLQVNEVKVRVDDFKAGK
ncbi:MAG TPA: alkaline shock response membrane anchor protein AmaP [Syntrophomonas sp.]|nr:alkaline shock response membrane anchor protein AmaP [Syntrophomonas sp.]